MKKRGFTLIELLVVIAILSTVLGVGLIRFKTIDRIKANIEVQTMINDINHVKIKAQTTGTAYRLILDRSSYTIKAGDAMDSTQPITRNLDYIEIDIYNNQIISYTPTGSVSKADTIRIKYKDDIDPNQVYNLVITVAGGHSRIEKQE